MHRDIVNLPRTALHQRGKVASVLRLKAALQRAGTRHLPCLHWLGQPLESNPPKIAVLEQTAGKPPRGHADCDLTRLGERLQAGCEVWRLAYDAMLLRDTFADEIAYDHEPGGDADPNLKCRILSGGELRDRTD